MFTSYDGLCGIGELAELAGVTVKTVRFYSDRGLLPEVSRSAGGHRRYGPEALGRLRLIRSLRALDLSVPEVRRILEADDEADDGNGTGHGGGGGASAVLESAVAERLRELGSELRALRWREAALRLVQECPPGERAGRLRLIGAVPLPPSTAPLVRFWRGWLPARMPARSAGAFLDVAVPQPPDDPAPSQVLAFARLNALTLAPCRPGTAQPQPEAHRAAGARGAAVLYAGLAEAYELAGVHLRRDRDPHPGEALDGFVAAYTGAYGVRDTPDFRRRLAGQLAVDPRLDGYWELVTEVITVPGGRPEPTPGSAHDWLLAALVGQTGATGWDQGTSPRQS
ncbi:MerR family transcriptional regulator [Streptomyces sp. BBFR51]|uniref:MerR family transcriptional regulator n=1 Tax=Streptomyces sp. BBFR51 TaxID=3372856 RepID=UPI0037DC3627